MNIVKMTSRKYMACLNALQPYKLNIPLIVYFKNPNHYSWLLKLQKPEQLQLSFEQIKIYTGTNITDSIVSSSPKRLIALQTQISKERRKFF